MSSITLDHSATEKLRECRQVTALCDASGKVIGYFEPPDLHVYKKGEIPEYIKEKLQKPLSESEKLTTDEVLRRLQEVP